jgi:alpha-L-rhamnosidase
LRTNWFCGGGSNGAPADFSIVRQFPHSFRRNFDREIPSADYTRAMDPIRWISARTGKTIGILLVATWFTQIASIAALRVGDLRCEHRVDPLGIDIAQPRLSWVLHSAERGEKQSAYQFIVASSGEKLRANSGDLWDTGRVMSDTSVLVPYAGKVLTSHTECFWKVRVWDANGKVSDWSKPAKWTMGILSPSEWNAKWIGLDGEDQTNALTGTSWIWFPEGDPAKSAPLETNYFRRVITIPAGRVIKQAVFQYTGDNEARGWINENDIGARNNFKTVKWNDVSTRIEAGKAYAFCLTGINGGDAPNPAGVIGLLTIEFTEGEPIVIQTDEKWKVSKSAPKGWNTPEFDDSRWVAAKIIGPAGMQPWGEARTSENRRIAARWLRKEFAVEKKISRATAYFSGLGSSELYLNGKKVGDAVLSPALSQYDERVYYVTYDVTKQIRRGANAVGAVLGGGRFYSDRSKVYAGTVNFGWPKMYLHLRLEHDDGSVTEIVSDESWKLTIDGPITSNGEFDGEEYDARKEFIDWMKPRSSDSPLRFVSAASALLTNVSVWQNAEVVAATQGQLVAQMNEPIRVTQRLKPIAMNEVKSGVFVFDLGQNMVGWCQLKVRGPAGTTVQLRHAETTNADGTLYMANLRGAQVTDRYTLKGEGTETWQPRFTYHGFRFVEVTGFPGKPALDALEGEVAHDDLAAAGGFACSNELLNRIYNNVVWGTRGNYRSIPTDCPQRDERQGWLGDRSEECKGESYIFNVAPLYLKWRLDISDAQKPSGSIPDVAPAYWPIYSDNVTWPSSAIFIPNMLRRQFGDTASISRDYDSSKKWIEYMLGFATNHIIARDSYGDWCVPPEEPSLIHSKDPARQTDKALLATSYFYHDLRLMERYARMLGKTADAQHWAKLADEFKSAFNDRFLNRDKGQYDNGSQTSCVLPLAFNLVPEDMKKRIFARLVDKIENETKWHIGTGLIGGQYLNRVLSDNGRADLAYRIAAQKDYPSWGYMVEQGATTIWELWNGNTADPAMNSGNHVMLVGDLGIWLYEYLAGIAPDDAHPGFKHIVMKPHPVGDLKWVKASHRSPYGLIRSEWKRDGDRFDWQIEIPANTTTTVYVPARNATSVTEGGESVSTLNGGAFVMMEKGYALFRLGSGKYHFVSK